MIMSTTTDSTVSFLCCIRQRAENSVLGQPIPFLRLFKIFVLQFSIFGVVAALLLWTNRNHILFTGDLFFYFDYLLSQARAPFPISQAGNYLIYGAAEYGLNPRVMPPFLIGSAVPSDYAVIVVYSIIGLELFAATFIAARLFGFSLLVAAMSSWTICLISLPFFWPYIVWVELSVILPGLNIVAATFILSTAIFYRLGRGTLLASAAALLALVLLAIYALVGFVQYSALICYALFFACGVLILCSANIRELAFKTGGVVLITGLFLLVTGFDYLHSYYSHNWANLIKEGGDMPSVRSILLSSFTTLLQSDFFRVFHLARTSVPATSGLLFACFTLLSSVLLLAVFWRQKQNPIRTIAVTFLVTILGYLLWRWAYIEPVILPLWVLVFSVGLIIACDSIACLAPRLTPSSFPDWIARRSESGFVARLRSLSLPLRRRVVESLDRHHISWVHGVVLGSLIVFVFLHFLGSSPWPAYRYGTTPDSDVFAILERDLSLNRSHDFRGRVAYLSHTDPTPRSDGLLLIYEAQQNLDHDIAFRRTGGSDYRRSGLTKKIPTLFDLNRFVSPGAVAPMNYFLTKPSHLRQDQFFLPTTFDIRWMRFFGVRYVVHNEQLAGLPKRAMHDYKDYKLYLYEIDDPNIGNYSPTRVVLSGSLAEMLTILDDSAFDFRDSVVVEEPINVSLVPAISSNLVVGDGELAFRAVSEGWSLVVLPFEYSHCLRMENRHQTRPLPKLLRVNSHQIGVLFAQETSVRLYFEFSLFSHRNCREEDIADWRKLNSAGVKTYRGTRIDGGMAK